MARRILILACSATKLPNAELMPARERYDGPAWRTLRAQQRVGYAAELEVFALSAEFGLIPAAAPIADYDRRMTPERSRELLESVAAELELRTDAADVAEILAFGGGVYRDLLENARTIAEEEADRPIPITFTAGGIGEQLGQLKQWLQREAGQ